MIKTHITVHSAVDSPNSHPQKDRNTLSDIHCGEEPRHEDLCSHDALHAWTGHVKAIASLSVHCAGALEVASVPVLPVLLSQVLEFSIQFDPLSRIRNRFPEPKTCLQLQ